MSRIIIGIDPSLSATGIVVLKDGEVVHAGVFGFKSAKDKTHWKSYEKNEVSGWKMPMDEFLRDIGDVGRINSAFMYITEFIDNYCEWDYSNEITVGIEIPMGSHAGAGAKTDRIYASYITGISSIVYSGRIEIITMVPGTIKKFVTGKGNAKKELILKEVFRKFEFDTSDNNIADAFAIAKYIESLKEKK
jgi:Holliday junction resolvasome RuvABC endonuclease subunit